MGNPSVTIPIGLTHYYKFGTLTTVVNTTTPGTDDLTDTGANATTVVTGTLGDANNFPGPDSYFAIAANGNHWVLPDVGGVSFAIACWVNFNSIALQPFGLNEQIIMMQGGVSDTQIKLTVRTDTSKAELSVVQPGGILKRVMAPVAMVTGTWYWIGAWGDSAAGEIGIINQVQTTVDATYSGLVRDVPASPIRHVSRRTDLASGYVDAIVDDLDIWNRRLTDEEFDKVYNDDMGQEDLLNIPSGGPGKNLFLKRRRRLNGSARRNKL